MCGPPELHGRNASGGGYRWRWRDGESVYYIPFDPSASAQTMAYYNVSTGENLLLTDPQTTAFVVANGDWAVSADGQRIVFMNANDGRLWMLQAAQ